MQTVSLVKAGHFAVIPIHTAPRSKASFGLRRPSSARLVRNNTTNPKEG